MLISFSVQNFRSFNDEVTLDLVASTAYSDHKNHCVTIAGTEESALRTSVVYGANASGKSNLVKAMSFAQDLVLEYPTRGKQIALEPFRFSGEVARPSSFEFRFMIDERIFTYGFDITTERVMEEWLYVSIEGKRERKVFCRKMEELSFGNFSNLGDDGNTSKEALDALKKLGVRANQLLLNKLVHENRERLGTLLNEVLWWFDDSLRIIRPNASFRGLISYLDEKEEFRRFTSAFLNNVGTGIGALSVKQSSVSTEAMPEEVLLTLQSQEEERGDQVLVGPGVSWQLDPENRTRAIRRDVTSSHMVGNEKYELPMRAESDGTRRLLNLLPALFHLRKERHVFVIDELERSLHPLLAYAFLKFFVDSCSDAGQQLVVTTHETHLLDQNLLRRDEIWFTEKDATQQTHLFSLAGMNARKDLRLEKSYLQGRFGAIPFVGGMDRIRDLMECVSEGTDG